MTALAQKGILEGTPLSVGSFIKQKRVQKGMSQKELADQTGINVSSIKQYERDGAFPTIEKAAMLAKILEFDANNLLKEVLEPGSTNLDDDDDNSIKPGIGHNQEQNRDDQGDEEALKLLKRLSDLVNNRGITARLLPNILKDTDLALSEKTPQELLDLGDTLADHTDETPFSVALLDIDPDALEDAPVEARGEFCDMLQSLLLVEVLYPNSYHKLTLRELKKLHEVTAAALGKQQPLRGVPMRSFLSDVMSSAEKDEAIRLEILQTLAQHLVEAAKQGRAILMDYEDYEYFPSDEPNEDNKVFAPKSI